MRSITNIFLFFVFVLLVGMSFLAVNVYIKKLTLKDLQGYISNPLAALPIKQEEQDISKPSTWSSILASKEIPNFSYPSPEISISLDFSNHQKTDVLEISNLDSYKLFCLKEILKSNNIQFTYKQVSKKATLAVSLNNAKQRQNLLSELERYNIAYKINKG